MGESPTPGIEGEEGGRSVLPAVDVRLAVRIRGVESVGGFEVDRAQVIRLTHEVDIRSSRAGGQRCRRPGSQIDVVGGVLVLVDELGRRLEHHRLAVGRRNRLEPGSPASVSSAGEPATGVRGAGRDQDRFPVPAPVQISLIVGVGGHEWLGRQEEHRAPVVRLADEVEIPEVRASSARDRRSGRDQRRPARIPFREAAGEPVLEDLHGVVLGLGDRALGERQRVAVAVVLVETVRRLSRTQRFGPEVDPAAGGPLKARVAALEVGRVVRSAVDVQTRSVTVAAVRSVGDELCYAVVDVVDVDHLVRVGLDQLLAGLDVGMGAVRRAPVEAEALRKRVVALRCVGGARRDAGNEGGEEQAGLRAPW